jgi:integrase
VAVPAPAVEALNAYLGTTGRELVAGTASVGLPLFTTASGNRWASSEAFRTVQRLARVAGVEGRISPHSLRHTFATLALDAGTTLHDLQAAWAMLTPGPRAGTTGHEARWRERQATMWPERLPSVQTDWALNATASREREAASP